MTLIILLLVCLAAVVLPIRRAAVRVERQASLDRLMHAHAHWHPSKGAGR